MKLAMLPTLLATAAAMKQGHVENGTLPEKEPDGADVCRVVADFSIKDMRAAASAFNHTATNAISKMDPTQNGSDIELLSFVNELYLNKTDDSLLKGRLSNAESDDKKTRQTAVTEFAEDYAKLALTDNFVLKPLAGTLPEPVKGEYTEALEKNSERIKNDSFHLMSSSACIADHASRK